MRENRLEYRRKLSNVSGWRNFSVQHVAFALHRITGWLLLCWVVVHLGLPAVSSGPSVWNPLDALDPTAATAVIVGLFAVLLFHMFNGVRLLAAELLGFGAGSTKTVFLGTLVVCIASVLAVGVAL